MNIAIIPARGGSKRIPRKNLKSFCGKPMIAYSIEAAQQSGLFDRIVISTDDEEIATMALNLGAEIPFMRPKNLADDFTPTVPVIAHAIQTLEAQGCSISAVCCIYATAPFINLSYLEQGYKKMIETGKKYVFPATTFPASIFRAFKITEDESVEMFWPDNYNTRSQDLPEAYHDAGQFYWGKPEAFLSGKPFFCNDATIIELPRHLVQDIDTPEDWIRAELMYQTLFSNLLTNKTQSNKQTNKIRYLNDKTR